MREKRYDVAIILGASLNPDSSLIVADQTRLNQVASIYKDTSIKAIVVCGSHGYKGAKKPTLSQAQAYANYLQGLGVPGDSIYLESKSQETLGNLLFAKMDILSKQTWRRVLVIPTYNHSSERISYLLQKILGNNYDWDILRVGENKDQTNTEREAKSLKLTKEINDAFTDGDHNAIYAGLMNTHPAYGGGKWSIDELIQEMKH